MFSICKPNPDVFGQDYEVDKERFQEAIDFYRISDKKPEKFKCRLVYNKESYEKFVAFEREFFHGKYKPAIKKFNGKLLLAIYDGISADLEKHIYVIVRKLFIQLGGNMVDLDIFGIGKYFYDNNLIFECTLGEKFNKLNRYSILLELISIHFYNDIIQYKGRKIIKFLCDMNKKYLKFKGISWMEFIH